MTSAAPLRLLIVSDEMEVGGSQRQIVHLIENLDPARWQVELAYFRNRSFLLDRVEAGGYPIHHVAKRRPIDPAFLAALVRLLRHHHYAVVHCYSFTAELWVRIALLLAPGAAFIASMRDMGQSLSPMQWRIKRAVCRGARAVVSNSTAAAARLRTEVGPRVPIRVVANGIEMPVAADPGELIALRARLGVRQGRALALFVGRLVEEKNVEMLLEALAAMPGATRPVLAIAGAGPLAATLRVRADSLGVADDVHFLGERDDIRELMQASDVVVLCSHHEGMSNVLLEAMAAGCAVIATAVGGNPELVVDGVTGILVPSGDRVRLTAALNRICDDVPLRMRLADAARERAGSCFSTAAMARGTAEIYLGVVDGSV